MLGGADRDRLLGVLARAQAEGALGPGPVEAHVEHAIALAGCAVAEPERFLDLGSGAGVPGLVLLFGWPRARAVLLDAQAKRARLLATALAALDLEGRGEVVHERAERAARRPDLRGSFDLVVARAFASPAATAECGAPFVRPGGTLLVSEPPEDEPGRWDAEGLARLGLAPPEACSGSVHAVALERQGPLDDRWPRRVGVPTKRPLW